MAQAHNVYIILSIHKQTKWDYVKTLLELVDKRGWGIRILQFSSSIPDNIPEWFNGKIKLLPEQQGVGKKTIFLSCW